MDPFLTKAVQRGERFWLCLYQNTVTGMRHHWSHPAFVENASEQTESGDPSVKWITKWAASLGMGYDEIMEHAGNYQTRGEYLNHGPRFEGEYVPDEFWQHYKAITGIEHSGSFFSCAC